MLFPSSCHGCLPHAIPYIPVIKCHDPSTWLACSLSMAHLASLASSTLPASSFATSFHGPGASHSELLAPPRRLLSFLPLCLCLCCSLHLDFLPLLGPFGWMTPLHPLNSRSMPPLLSFPHSAPSLIFQLTSSQFILVLE